jgi:hypothetical protein
MATSTRGARHLANVLTEDIHDQQRRALASAHRSLDALKAEQDRLSELPWHRPERRGQLVALIRDAEQRITQLTQEAWVERAFSLEPIAPAPPVAANGSRRGMPPAWYLPKPAANARRRSGARRGQR